MLVVDCSIRLFKFLLQLQVVIKNNGNMAPFSKNGTNTLINLQKKIGAFIHFTTISSKFDALLHEAYSL